MTTKELSEKTGVPLKTIRKLVGNLNGIYVGGRTGWILGDDAERRLIQELNKRLFRRRGKGRKSRKISTDTAT